jgi:hypothetical protein
MNHTYLSMRLVQGSVLAFALACMGCHCACEDSTINTQTSESTVAGPEEAKQGQQLFLAAAEGGGWGTLKGQAVFAAGDVPAVKEIKVDKDAAHCLSKGAIPNEEWVINPKNKGVRWTFVWLAAEDDPINKGKLPIHPDLKAPKVATVEMDQPCCRFEPHALAMREDQELIFKNSAPIPHNVNYTGDLKNPGDNKLLPAGAQLAVTMKASTRPVSVACNIHSWMKAYVRVYDHPYFAVTDENGNFEIKNAPAGKWRLIAWHETGGWLLGKRLTKENFIPVEIKADGATEVKIDVKPTE